MTESVEYPRQKITKEAWRAFIKIALCFLVVISAYIAMHSLSSGGIEAKLSTHEITTATYILTDTTLDRKERSGKMLDYIIGCLRPADDVRCREIRKIYGMMNNNAVFIALPYISTERRSYFWLFGEKKYIEVIFWAVFGVLANLIYYASENMRTGRFRPDELPVYVAKLIYAPWVTLVIILGYDIVFTSSQSGPENYSYGLIVFSFVLGFFSGRAVGLLSKLKDAILPSGKEIIP